MKKIRGLTGCLATAAALWSGSLAWADVTNTTTNEIFATIQGAINDSDTVSGHTLVVSDGTYTENVSITKNITLRSATGRTNTTIQGTSNGDLGTIRIAPGSNGVTLGGPGQGFTILGIDNPSPGIESAAVYLQGAHANTSIIGNEIVAAGDAGLMSEFGLAITNLTIDGNIFSGQTFVGPNPADVGFNNQFTTPNVPRQLVVLGCGTNCATMSGVQFTNNQITGTAGGLNPMSQEQGNTLVTIDATNVTITGNTSAGTTTRFGSSLRARGVNTSISGNTFDGSGQTATTNYVFIANPSTPNDLSTDPVSLVGVRNANTFSPPALIVPGQPATLFVGFNNQLALEIADCPDDYDTNAAGYQIAIELRMRDLTQNATGFAAFLEYNTTQLTYRGDLSSYTNSPFSLHIPVNISAAEGPAGILEISGSDTFGGGGSSADALLATLVFTVNVECGSPSLEFDLDAAFPSTLSFQGSPIPTPLVNPPTITLDNTPPLLTAPNVVELECPTNLPPAATTLGGFLALVGAGAADNCAMPDGATPIGSSTGSLVGDICSGTITRTYTIADACGNTETVDHVFNVSDDTPPTVNDPAGVTLQCRDDLPNAATTIAAFLALPGASASDNCAAQAALTVSSVDVVVVDSDCSGQINRHYTITDTCLNATMVTQTFMVDDQTDPMLTCPPDISVDADAGVCTAVLNFVETFDDAVPVCATQTPNCWFVDRYAPGGFESAFFDGDDRLKHSITAAGSRNGRPPAFASDFYNTQGRKHDVNLPVGSKLEVDLHLGADWATGARRADMWATARDTGDAISGYPIVGFISNDPNDPFNPNPVPANVVTRLRIYSQDTDNNPGNGVVADWVYLTMPGGFLTFDSWYRLSIELTPTAYEYTITNESNVSVTYTDNVTFGAIRFGDVMLQAYNFTNNVYPGGSAYDVYWDNLLFGPQGPIATDNCCIDSVTPVRSDNAMLTLNDPFPQGSTTITWTVTDCCGNTASCNQTVNVSSRNQVEATVQLTGVDATGGLTRCIRFTPRNGMTCGDTEYVQVSFSGNPAVGVASFDIECGDWTELCVKDEQHTLISTGPLTDTGALYVTAGTIALNGGDTDNDSDVDINDLTWLIFDFGTSVPSNGTCTPWNPSLRSADFSNDGAVTADDYTFITTNWLTFSACNCSLLATGGKGEAKGDSIGATLPESTRIQALSADFPPEVARKADLNRDGVIDVRDVEQFEMLHNLSGELSAKLRNADSARPSAAPKRK